MQGPSYAQENKPYVLFSLVHHYFEHPKDAQGKEDRKLAVCKLCKCSLSFSSSTTSLLKHVRCYHPDVLSYSEVEAGFNSSTSAGPAGYSGTGSFISVPVPSGSSGDQPLKAGQFMDRYVHKKYPYSKGNAHNKDLDRFLARLVVDQLLPLSFFDEKIF